MKSFFNRKLIHMGLSIFVAFTIELITYGFMFHQIRPYMFLDLLLFIFFSSFIFFFKKSLFDVIYLPIMLFLVLALSVANTNFYLVFGDIFSIHHLYLIKGGVALFSFSYINLFHLGITVTLYVIYLGLMIFLYKYEKKHITADDDKPLKIKGVLASLVLCLSIGGYTAGYLGVTNHESTKFKNKDVFNSVPMLKTENFEIYGLASYYVRETSYLIFGPSDNTLNTMQDYFKTPVNTDNNFTGTLKDKNVVVIMIETGDDLMVNEYLTPNLYQMINDGVDGARNYSKNKTNTSEVIGITGSTSTVGILPNNKYSLPFSTPSLLNDQYNTMYFHDTGGKNDVYGRKTLIPQYGFENIYFHDDINPDLEMWTWDGGFTLDSITMPRVGDIILKDTSKPFYAFYTSLSMHGPYINCKNEETFQKKYGAKLQEAKDKGLWTNPLKDDPYGDDQCIDTYMMAAMDFDYGLGEMIDKFKEKGEFDDTLFVIYGDHECYYNGKENITLNVKLGGHDDYTFIHPDLFKTVLTFYNPQLNELYKDTYGNTSINQFTSPYVIVPTILDLLGVPYNANMYMGNSIFAPQFKDTQVMYSLELSSFFNDELWAYNDYSIYARFNEQADEEAFLNQVQNLMERQVYLDVLYDDAIFSEIDFRSYNYR